VGGIISEWVGGIIPESGAACSGIGISKDRWFAQRTTLTASGIVRASLGDVQPWPPKMVGEGLQVLLDGGEVELVAAPHFPGSTGTP
jgi:hypothetical protein